MHPDDRFYVYIVGKRVKNPGQIPYTKSFINVCICERPGEKTEESVCMNICIKKDVKNGEKMTGTWPLIYI